MENITESDQRKENNYRPETIVIINCILNAPLMLISITGNSLVLAAILRTPALHSPSIMFLCSLAVSDLLVGLVVQPLYIAYELTRFNFLYRPMTIMAVTGVGVSLCTITVISVDRFLALHYHMRYPSMVTMYRAKYTIATLWLLNFLVSFFAFWKISAYYFIIAFTIPIYLLLSTVCYIRIYRIVRRHQYVANTRSTTCNGEFKWSKQRAAIGEKCQKHFHILHSDDSVLYTTIYFHDNFIFLLQSLDSCLELNRYCSIY